MSESDINLWLAGPLFVISLPLAVVLGAALLGLQDVQDRTPNLLRILVCVTALMLLLLALGRHYLPVIIAAMVLVYGLHLCAYWALRFWARRNSQSYD